MRVTASDDHRKYALYQSWSENADRGESQNFKSETGEATLSNSLISFTSGIILHLYRMPL